MAEANTSNSQDMTAATEDTSSIQQAIYKSLGDKEVKTINIFGSVGVGKTRLAKRVSDRAIREMLFSFTLWVYMCREYTEESLSASIARQLGLHSPVGEWEVEDDDKEQKNDNEVENSEKLTEKIKKNLEGLKVLLILDDCLSGKTENANENKFWGIWKNMFPNLNFKTVLISRVSREDNSFEVKALSIELSNSLLIEKLDPQLKNSKIVQALGKKFIGIINGNLPGTVIMLAKALKYFSSFGESSILEKELEEASEKYNVSKLLCMKHDVLPIGVLKDLWWRGHHFFRDSGSVHYSELITYWILEGFLGFGSMTNLYKKGHAILIDLMDCGVLKGQEDGYVFMDQSLIKIDNLYDQCVDENPSLGLTTFFTSEAEGFGRITHEDGMLKTPRARKKRLSSEGGQNLTTLLLDGTHFTEQVMVEFLESEKKLQVLALFNPTIKSLPRPLGMMDGLRVLVLRGCEYLQDVRVPNHPLKSLNVLEISGARSLKSLRSVFFSKMSNLKSLHLSGLQITTLPTAIYNLDKLQWLIIKDCPLLKELESISKFKNLMVVDLSGNIALDTVDKNFLKFTQLQSLNLSQTRVSTTPLLKNIGSLTHLLCRECTGLGRLRGLTSLTSLQTIDLSGSTEFEEFHDSSLESLCSLRTLNLSGTVIDRLPSNISKPRYLYLKNCLKLKQLSCIKFLENLEVLDLSGSTNLKEIKNTFFEEMTHLRILNLSETNVTLLPSLSKLSDLRELFLSCCKSLTHLPSLESSKKLEILDISKCSVLEEVDNKSFEAMTHLQKLDCSETKIKSLPSLSDPSTLRQLLLKNCKELTNLEINVSFVNLEVLNLSGVTSFKRAEFVNNISTLQILDLSNTSVEHLPSISKLKNLTHISLADCKFIETELDLNLLCKLEVLDLSRSSIKRLLNLTNCKNLQKLLLKDCLMVEDFPYEKVTEYPKIPNDISGLSHLDYLEFPNLKADSNHQDEWNVCLLSEDDKPPIFHSGSQFLQLMKNDTLVGPCHICAVPAKVDGQTGDRYLQRLDLVFRDLYLQASHFTQYKENKLLQIRGFSHFPNGIENIISEVNAVFLVDYKLKGLPSGFDPSILIKIKGFWIERCDEFITIFNEKEDNDNSSFEFPMENFGVSNNLHLKGIYNGKKPFGSFYSLKSLYLDNCPMLETVFTSSWLPSNLEVLQIKYCDNITSLLENGGELPKLETLHLWELPELKNIGISFPSLKTLKIWECPKLKETVDQFEIASGLKTLWICGATSLKSLCTRNETFQDSINLETLKLENCAMLEYVISSCSPLVHIHTIEITSCEKIQTLFTEIDNKTTRLNTLHLEDLPMLKSIGARFPPSVEIRTFECPNLQLGDAIVSLTRVDSTHFMDSVTEVTSTDQKDKLDPKT